MIRLILIILTLLISPPTSAQSAGGISPIDPFLMTELPGVAASQIIMGNSGTTARSQTINTGIRNLVLICAGQSQFQNIIPTLYIPTNTSVIDNFSIYNGGSYSITGPVIGTLSGGVNGGVGGPGNICPRIADLLINNNIFDKIILVPVAVGGTQVSDWSTGALVQRLPVTMRRLLSRSITPSTTGVTFAMTWGQGESDCLNGTSTANYEASFTTVVSNLVAAGFLGRIFINQESWISGTTCSAVTTAQSALVNGTTIFAGADLDLLGAGDRQSDNTHFNDTGAAAAASAMYTAMHASGSPF